MATSFDLWSADDAGLDPYQFRLLAHIARVGTCWKSYRTMAAHCRMSVAKTHEVRRWLADNGFIERTIDERSGKVGWRISEKCSCDEQAQQYKRSPGEQSVRQANKAFARRTKRSPGEQKDPTIRNQQKETTEGEGPDLKLAAMVNALADATGMSGHLNWSALSDFSQELLPAYTADQIILHYTADSSPNGHWNWYKDDWRGRQGDFPSIQNIRQTISGATRRQPTSQNTVEAIIAEALSGVME